MLSFGENLKPRPKLPSFSESLIDALNDRILLAVGIFAILSMITGTIYNYKTGWFEGLCIIFALLIQIVIISVNDFVKDRQFLRLNNTTRDENLPVLRGKAGSMQTVNIWDLVVGDIVQLKAGDRVPADCIIIESVNVLTDESMYTG